MEIIALLKNKVYAGSDRSVKVKKNIICMLFLRGANILIGLLLIPMTLNYVNSTTYGIWLALSSMIAWISFFDVGINNGLKNHLAQAFALGDYNLGKKYVSTTYAILILIFIPLMLILLLITPYVNWNYILNISTNETEGLLSAIAIVIAYFCINFILNTVNIVLLADQRPAYSSFLQFLQQFTSLLIIYLLTITTKGSLTNLCLGLCASPILIAAIFNFYLFNSRYNVIAPSIINVDFSVAPNLLKLGVQFLIIQIAAIVQYQMINFLILRYYGASEVTSYNIAFKYFSILTMLWGILTTPLWAAVTDAMTRKDYQWIKDTQKKYLNIYILFTICGILMLSVSSFLYDFWIGDKVSITFKLSAFVLIYNLSMMFGTVFVMIVNGSGQLKIQMYASLISPFVFLGVFYLCCKVLNIGIISVLIAAIISNFNGLILAPLQCYKMLHSQVI